MTLAFSVFDLSVIQVVSCVWKRILHMFVTLRCWVNSLRPIPELEPLERYKKTFLKTPSSLNMVHPKFFLNVLVNFGTQHSKVPKMPRRFEPNFSKVAEICEIRTYEQECWSDFTHVKLPSWTPVFVF